MQPLVELRASTTGEGQIRNFDGGDVDFGGGRDAILVEGQIRTSLEDRTPILVEGQIRISVEARKTIWRALKLKLGLQNGRPIFL